MKPRKPGISLREWGIIIHPKAPSLLGWGWFPGLYPTTSPLGSVYPARFKTRREARVAEAFAAGRDYGYFKGRFRVVRLTSTFTWERAR
jgi:hypothetical protein